MKNLLLFLSFIFCITSSYLSAETPYSNGSVLNVFASSGLKLRAMPNTSAEVLDIVRYGDQILVLNNFEFAEDKCDQIEYVDGHWILVEYQGIAGYLFDGYLSGLPFPSSQDQLVDEGYSFAYTLGEYVDQNFEFIRTLDSTHNKQAYLLANDIKVRRIIKESTYDLRIDIPNVKISDLLNVMRSMLPNRETRYQFDRQLVFIADDNGTIFKVKSKGPDHVSLELKENGHLVITAKGTTGC
ncbi:MAG: SH3 domain-containing protein [Saprospiraceae bacterium]|nr:SH3 domain-containing protein [Saprospiraceae bacterium]